MRNVSRRLIVCGVAVFVAVALLPRAASAQEGETVPTAPSQVQAAQIKLPDGTTAVRLRWIDNAENELGFKAVDQRTGQEYDALPNTGPTGAMVTLTIPVASGCFRVFAYNNYGASPLSDLVCAPATLPATGGDNASGALPIIALRVAIACMAAGIWAHRRSTASSG